MSVKGLALRALFLAILLAIPVTLSGQKAVVINRKISYIAVTSVDKVTWQEASNRCQSLHMELCMKKDLCATLKSSKVEVPRRFIPRATKIKYVPVDDTYNEWIDLGPIKSTQCQRITKTEGPPVWRGKGCKDATGYYNKFQNFCTADSGFYCCRKATKKAEISPHPVAVHITSYQENNDFYYSFSPLKVGENRIDKKWQEKGRQPKDVKKFSLMSGFTKGKFVDPIFFCSKRMKSKQGNSILHQLLSDRWCPFGWSLNFCLYGSLSSINDSQKLVSHRFGDKPFFRSRVNIGTNTSASRTDLVFYGPTIEDGNHIELYSTRKKFRCTNETVVLTSLDGAIEISNNVLQENLTCRWKIQAPSGSVIRITFTTLNLMEGKPSVNLPLEVSNYFGGRVSTYNFYRNCNKEKLEILGYGKFCGTNLPPSFLTLDNEVEVIFSRTRLSQKKRSRFSLVYAVITPPNGLSRERLFDRNLTWNSGKKECEKIGKSLCLASDVCGQTDGRPFYGVQEGDQWTPVKDNYNDWLQIGRGNVLTCSKHIDAFGPPIWGNSRSECDHLNIHFPCPRRDYLYCCSASSESGLSSDQQVTVLIYTTIQNGVVFSKYLRQGVDNPKSFDSATIWTRSRKRTGDYTSIKLSTGYSSAFNKAVYFCQRKLFPAVARLTHAYAMLIQPCQSQGWKYLYHLYGMSTQKRGTLKYFVGMYEKRPHHSRIHTGKFPQSFRRANGYIIYGYGRTISSTETTTEEAGVSACADEPLTVIAPSVIESPGYPISYQPNSNCRWILKKSNNEDASTILKLTIVELDLEDPVDVLTITDVGEDVPDHYDSIRSKSKQLTGTVSQVTMETTRHFELNFTSDSSISGKGFLIKVDIISSKCGGEIRSSGDVIFSPNYPLSYPAESKCEWTIEAPDYHYDIEFEVELFDLVADEKCSHRLIISGGPIATTLCGQNAPAEKIHINGSSAKVKFIVSKTFKNGPKSGKGFAIRIYFIEKLLEAKPQCGVQSVPFNSGDHAVEKITEGSEAVEGNFPWMVHVTSAKTYCGGTLISQSWVLTAAHCIIYKITLDGRVFLNDKATTYRLIAGRHIRNVSSPGEQVQEMKSITYRSDYEKYAKLYFVRGRLILSSYPYNDILLIKMKGKMIYTPMVQPICLPTQDVHVGDTCYIAGWGDTTLAGASGTTLRYGKAPILEDSLCNTFPLMQNSVMENALCAGFPDGGASMCYGDSGGPLICQGRYGNFYVNGIISWSIGCGGKDRPGVFVRLYKFTNWIKNVTADGD